MASNDSPGDGGVTPRRDNPYMHARTEWAERYGDYIASARNWRFAAIASMIVSCALAVDNWHLANKSSSVPYIVERDHLGQLLYVGPATQAEAHSPLIVRAAISTWLKNARSILTDPRAERANIDQVYAFLAKGSPAYTELTAWFGTRQPFVLSQTEEVSVAIDSAIPVGSSARTWQIQWTETTTQSDGSQAAPEHWIATVTFDINSPAIDSPQARANPIGLEVTNYNWAKQS